MPPDEPASTAVVDTSLRARRSRRRRRVLLSELALTITFTLATAAGLADRENLVSVELFVAGWGLHLLVLALCFVLPWSAIGTGWIIFVPLIDFVAIALSRMAAGEALGGFGLLAAFPVVWLAASRVTTRSAVTITILASLGIIALPFLIGAEDLTVDALIDRILLPIMLTGLAGFVSGLTKENRRRQEALRVSQAALSASVEASRDRERLLGTIIDTVGVGLLAVDAEGHDILMNARLRASHAAAAPPDNDDPTEAELLMFGPDRVTPIPPEERPVRRAVQGEDLAGEQVWAGTGRSQRAISVRSNALVDEDGAFAGTIVAFNDVTELVLALQAKDDFLSNVSHEFRTPLTAILGYLDLTLELAEDLPTGVAGHLEVARRNALRLEQLVEDLLAINAGTFEVNPQPTDVGKLLTDAASSSQIRADRVNVEIINEAPASLQAVVDPVRLAQAVDNLLSNAVKYNRRGGSITLRAGLDDDDGLTVEVMDTGIGIEEEDLHRVFDRFFRSPSLRATSVPGVGLGLLITRSIVNEHGGIITVTSEPGRGSRFRISIPQPA